MRHFSDRTRRALLAAAVGGLTLAAQSGCNGYYRVGYGYPYGRLGHYGGHVRYCGDGDGALVAAGIIGGIILLDAIADGVDYCWNYGCSDQWGYYGCR